MDELAKKKKIRGGHRGSATKMVTKIIEKLVDAQASDKNWFIQSKITLSEKIEVLKHIDEEIISLLSETEGENVENDIEKEIEETDNLRAELGKVIIDVSEFIESCSPPSASSAQSLSLVSPLLQQPVTKTLRARLPKLEVRKFSGRVQDWQEFWDSFESSIDKNEGLSIVDKFSYLRGLIEEPAKSTIAGFALTAANYSSAVELLKNRFGKPIAIQRAHINELMKLQPVFNEKDTIRLRKLYDTCETHHRGLDALGVSEESYSAIVVPTVMDKLPEQFRLTITRGVDFLSWNMKEMLEAFIKELELRETHNAVNATISKKHDTPTTAYSLFTSQETEHCAFCLQKHAHENCRKITDPGTRKNIARKYARCFKCLRKGHRVYDCQANLSCNKCGGKHHTALCDSRGSHTQNDIRNGGTTTSSGMHVGSGGKVALQTAQGIAQGDRNMRVRVLFDSGSHRSFITSKAADIIRPKVIRQEWLEVSTFGQEVRNAAELREVVELRVTPLDSKKVIVIEAYVVPNISNIQNNHVELEKREYSHLTNLWFSDVCIGQEVIEINVLVGSDYLWRFQRGETRRGKPDEPVAVETELGWVLSGPLRGKDVSSHKTAQVYLIEQVSMKASTEESLVRDVHKLWDLETLGIREEDDVQEKFLDSIEFTGERYSVTLPWKEGNDRLPSNYSNSVARLKGQLRKLKKEPEVLMEYDHIMKDQLRNGVIERVSDLERSDKVHYLPHHGVVRRDATTTKLRIVYDASSKESTGGTSLNDCLHTGPPLNPLLYDILLRFRMNQVALVGDIEKAFLNVEVDRADRDCLRFLWLEDVSDSSSLVVYRFCRVVFGLNSSPFLLNATLRHHISRYEEVDPVFARKLQDSFYVDDLVSGECSLEAAYTLYKKSKSSLATGGFKLRKWLTNDKELRERIQSIQDSDRDDKEFSTLHHEESYAKSTLDTQVSCKGEKVLGQSWDIEADCFKFELASIGEKAQSLAFTKRNMLSILAGIFDPLGILSPAIVCAKIMFQEVCGGKRAQWDEELPAEVKRKWEEWCKDLVKVGEIRLSRCVFEHKNEEVLECYLHGFGDASKKAYCAVIYLVYRTSQGIHVNLLTSKTRVAPLKVLSIPRLELMSARILAQQMNIVKTALSSQINLSGTRMWLDSKTALYWIRNRGEWKQFVHHRVNEILQLTSKSDWGHCPGEENPADLGSRGVLSTKLKENKLWWEGPTWLSGPQEGWPTFEMGTRGPEISEEEKKCSVLVVKVDTVHDISTVIDVNRYCKLERLLRVTAWVKRFVHNSRVIVETRRVGRLEVKELLDAENDWIEGVQAMLKGQDNFDQLVKTLGLASEGKIMRCKGRLGNSQLEYESKHPVILPKDHRLTELIIMNCHKKVHHDGVRGTLAEFRSKYWISKGRQVVKKVVGKCVTCKRWEGKPYSAPAVAALPEFRVREAAPFSNSGVDFAGPLFIKEGVKELSKVYIALFTCCVTRAVHLDLVEALSAPVFLRCFRRFAARRGAPRLMISDNAKTFKASDKALKDLYNHPEVQADLETRRIVWRFNMERAPWWGGFFERMVGSVKRCLRKVLGNARLSYDELLTVLIEIESTLNTRPLTYDYDELENEVLTPSHLIYGRRLTSIPDVVVEEDEEGESSSSLRFKYLSVKLGHYWSRWQKEYLTDLREFHRRKPSNNNTAEVKEGDVVTVYGEGKKRGRWKTAVVDSLVTGKDGEVRGANVKTITKGKPKMLCRPLQKLYPIEVRAEPRVKEVVKEIAEPRARRNPTRAAAVEARMKIRAMVDS